MVTKFLGTSKKTAQNLAEKNNLVFRLIRIDSEDYFTYPTEKRGDTICVELDDGKVSKAAIY